MVDDGLCLRSVGRCHVPSRRLMDSIVFIELVELMVLMATNTGIPKTGQRDEEKDSEMSLVNEFRKNQ